MRPIVTPTEMAAIDAEAPEPVAELIERAGWATARAALDLLDRPYGSRVLILAGPGNNGADGRAAVRHLERAGVHCTVADVRADPPARAPGARPERPDLVIDAAYGTGLRRPFAAADLPVDMTGELAGIPVLAVDIPSGVDGLTGERRTDPIPATATVTFAAAKPGLVLEPGRSLAGRITVADIGLDCSRATIHELEAADLDRWPTRAVDDHKWRRAVAVVGGSPGLTGAPGLSAAGALRAGAGYATISTPPRRGPATSPSGGSPERPDRLGRTERGLSGLPDLGPLPPRDPGPSLPAALGPTVPLGWSPSDPPGLGTGPGPAPGPGPWPGGAHGSASPATAPAPATGWPIEAVGVPIGPAWFEELEDLRERLGAAVVGPGLADEPANRTAVRRWWTEADVPTVFDAGALTILAALGVGDDERSGPGRPRTGHVITPHDGEFARLTGHAPGPDRIAAARELASAIGAIVLLKGPTTVVADPDGAVLVSTAGDARLATAGTGDVLAGVVAAGLAGGLDPLTAAGLGAELHGRAARLGPSVGLVASDLPPLVARWLSARRQP